MLYHWHEFNHALWSPARWMADMCRTVLSHPDNPFSHLPPVRSTAAMCEMFERTTRRYGKPAFGITETEVAGTQVPIAEEVVWRRPFCRLLHFRKVYPESMRPARQPAVLMVAPLSGHYATLLRDTVRRFLPDHDVYITDWADARMVPLSEGPFDLDDYIDYVIEMLDLFAGDVHVMAVCQPSVPVLAAVSLLAEEQAPSLPRSMILMGGPVDTRRNPTQVNRLAEEKGVDWFARHVIMRVPWTQPGAMRRVYPGFLQITGFMTMNLDRHVDAHRQLFRHLIAGDGDSADRHRAFYDEYLAVMDLAAEYYLQTVDTVFVRHLLPQGRMTHRGRPVTPEAIEHTALMTVEGEKDDITGLGQTEAAHDLCRALPQRKRAHYVQTGVGHYGVFNGSRFRAEIAPRIAKFIATHDRGKAGPRPTGEKPAGRETPYLWEVLSSPSE